MQVPKDHVREAFVSAAARSFAERGYAATSMAGVAESAGSSVGNLYKYFRSKEELFEAAVPSELVTKLERLTHARMHAFGRVKDAAELPERSRYHALAGELLDYCLANRDAVVVVLNRAEATPHATFRANFVQKLTRWALSYARAVYPELLPTPELRYALDHAYQSFVSAVAGALRDFRGDAQARAVIALLTAQHQGGLKRLFETQGETHAESSHAEPSPLFTDATGPSAGAARAASADPRAAGARAGQADRPRRARRRS